MLPSITVHDVKHTINKVTNPPQAGECACLGKDSRIP